MNIAVFEYLKKKRAIAREALRLSLEGIMAPPTEAQSMAPPTAKQ
jgi:hypothetical protein